MKIATVFLSLLFAQQSCGFTVVHHGTAATATRTATTTSSSTTSTTALNMVGSLQRTTGRSQLDPQVIAKYDALPYPKDSVLAEYVWVDADGNTRSKTRTIPAEKVRLFVEKLISL